MRPSSLWFCLVSLLPRLALAETANPPAPAPAPAPQTPTPEAQQDNGWYGWQLLVVDGASIATGAVVASTLEFDPDEQPADAGLVAATWYGLGAVAAPAVHYAHGNSGVGAASLSLRLLVPPLTGVFGFLGACVRDGEATDHDCVQNSYAGGTMVGLAGVAALDAALMAWERPHPEPNPPRYWYGWQLVMIDGAAIAAGIALGASPREDSEDPIHPAAAPWAMDYLVGLVAGPVVHFAHGNVGTGFISLGARALAGPMFAVAGIAGYCAATAGVTNCSKTGAIYGLLGGLAIVDIFDALVLAHDEVTPTAQEARYAPYVSVGPNSVALGGYF